MMIISEKSPSLWACSYDSYGGTVAPNWAPPLPPPQNICAVKKVSLVSTLSIAVLDLYCRNVVIPSNFWTLEGYHFISKTSYNVDHLVNATRFRDHKESACVSVRSRRKMYLSPSCGSMRLFIALWYRSGLAQSTSFHSLRGRHMSKARLPVRSSNSTIPKDQISLCRVSCPVWIYSGAAYSTVPSTWQTWKTKPWD
jgi:hypothetical protein